MNENEWYLLYLLHQLFNYHLEKLFNMDVMCSIVIKIKTKMKTMSHDFTGIKRGGIGNLVKKEKWKRMSAISFFGGEEGVGKHRSSWYLIFVLHVNRSGGFNIKFILTGTMKTGTIISRIIRDSMAPNDRELNISLVAPLIVRLRSLRGRRNAFRRCM